MIVCASSDSQYVQSGTTEWMPNWKRTGWTNSKKSGIANKSLWMVLDVEIARHRLVQFPWVKTHSWIVLNEIADNRATRGVNGSSNCPTNRFGQLPEDTEPEDGPELSRSAPVITQTAEWDEEIHLPPFSTQQKSHKTSRMRFSRDVLGNPRAW
jgi:hypothetical protein